MNRYFLTLAYRGTDYHGWQRQPHSTSVQETLEKTLGLILREEITVVGCGRTDAGVHASHYVAHLDTGAALPHNLLRRLNRMLPGDIAVSGIRVVGPVPPPGERSLHARFSAMERAYRYDVIRDKDPFRTDLAWHHPAFAQLELAKLNAAAAALLDYDEFAPFCKTHSDARTMRCNLRRSEWVLSADGTQLSYHIAADRFLRGMVRLIVGACVQVALGKLDVGDVRAALDAQTPLAKPVSVPACGLYLVSVEYH